MNHLLLRLHGPMCSWGDIAPGIHRPTHSMPTRSAVLGLLASALGIARDDEPKHDELSASVGIAARRECIGAITMDYHTVQTPSRERKLVWPTRRDELMHANTVNTIVSLREHVEDAVYTVAIWQRTSTQVSLESIRNALETPRYPPYLGRRSCPTALPFGAQIVNAPTLREAFDAAAFPDVDSQVIVALDKSGGASLHVEFDDHPDHGYGPGILRHPRRDEITSRARRTFRERNVHIAQHPRGDS